MDKMAIAFPNLGIYLEYVPKSVQIGPVNIALYGIIIALGVLVGFHMADYVGRKAGLPKDIWWDFSVPAIIFSVLGARIYYVVFSWDYYKEHLNQILNIRQGGIAVYGSVIGGFLTLYVFSRLRKVDFVQMADAGVVGLLTGQIIGRWGNFTNREVFGRYTDGLFAMRLPIEMVRERDISADIAAHITDGVNYIQVHPTFLYESFLNLLLLVAMLLYRRYQKQNGEICLMYLGGYGIIRFFVEGIRTDQLLIGHTGIAVSQLLGIILFVAAVAAEIILRVYAARRKTCAVQAESAQDGEKSEGAQAESAQDGQKPKGAQAESAPDGEKSEAAQPESAGDGDSEGKSE